MATPAPPAAPGRPRLSMLITELVMGGAARVFRDHSRALASHFEIHEAVFDESLGMDFAGETPPASLDRGRRSRGPLRPLLNLARRVRAMRRLKRDRRIDVAISHLEGAHFVDLLSRQGERTVLVVHGSLLHNRSLRGPKALLREKLLIPALYNRADRVVAVSRDILPELEALGVSRDRLVAINNFFDVEAIAARAREPLPEAHSGLFLGDPVLVTMARIHQQKNPLGAIAMFAALRRLRPARLLWLGDGPMRPDLVRRAAELGLRVSGPDGPPDPAADVVLLGNCPNPFPYVARSALFVLPSLWEGFPMALCEAMACRVPVAAADCPTGPREILGDSEHGLLLPMIDSEADAETWARRLAGLLDDPAERERLAAAGQRRVLDFTPQRIVPQWVALVEGLLAERR